MCRLLMLPAAAFAACAQAAPDDTAALAREWRTLRAQRGHFEGGRWNDDLDRWQGRKHQLMQSLAQRAREAAWTQADLQQWLGLPDAQWPQSPNSKPEHTPTRQQTRWDGAAPPPEAVLWVYHWRGSRDRLIVALHGGRVVATGWLFEHEAR
jgi:hypothetical protein